MVVETLQCNVSTNGKRGQSCPRFLFLHLSFRASKATRNLSPLVIERFLTSFGKARSVALPKNNNSCKQNAGGKPLVVLFTTTPKEYRKLRIQNPVIRKQEWRDVRQPETR